VTESLRAVPTAGPQEAVAAASAVPAPPAAAPAARPDSGGKLEIGALRRAWRAVLEDGSGVPPGMGFLLRAAELSVVDDRSVSIGLAPGSPVLERMENPATRKPLMDALVARLGRSVNVAFVSSAGSGVETSSQRITAETARRDRLRRLVDEDPLLAAAVREWDLELLE
jgi:hypothetical protein